MFQNIDFDFSPPPDVYIIDIVENLIWRETPQ